MSGLTDNIANLRAALDRVTEERDVARTALVEAATAMENVVGWLPHRFDRERLAAAAAKAKKVAGP